MNTEKNFSTLCVQGAQTVDDSKSRGVPVHRTAAYLLDDTAHAADLFALKRMGNIYTRIMNPTQAQLENRMSLLEGGTGALALASGTSAIFYTVINICRAGDHVVSSSKLYGGTYTMFDAILPDLGIDVTFVDPAEPQAFERAVEPQTRLIYTEIIGNPTLDVVDLDAVAAVAKRHRLPLVVDATFNTPYLLRPLEHGADVVIHSLTKWIGGHGTAIGGIVVDGGVFDWTNPKFALYNQPDRGYHGIRWGHDLGDLQPAAFAVRMRLVPLRNLGACISPDNAWMFLQGMETLPLRMQKHSENALAAARFLEKDPRVAWVRYPGLENDFSYPAASKLLRNGYGGMVVFGIKGGMKSGRKFIESLELFSHLANVGDAKSLAIHPPSTTHSQLNPEQLASAGIGEDLIRLSIGIEDTGDILADIDQALKKAV